MTGLAGAIVLPVRLDPSRAYRITVDFEITEIKPKNGTDFKLEELYSAIGCTCIEVLRLHKNRWMVLDEEGKLKARSVNALATALSGLRTDVIAGDVVVCPEGWLL